MEKLELESFSRTFVRYPTYLICSSYNFGTKNYSNVDFGHKVFFNFTNGIYQKFSRKTRSLKLCLRLLLFCIKLKRNNSCTQARSISICLFAFLTAKRSTMRFFWFEVSIHFEASTMMGKKKRVQLKAEMINDFKK